MSNNTFSDIHAPMAKSGLAIGGAGASKAIETAETAGRFLGIATWADLAAALAAIYTLCLWGEWLWKRLIRPFAVRRGWLPPALRRKEDRQP